METNFNLVQEMHRKFGLLETEKGPRGLTDEEFHFRIKAMFEELLEYVEAATITEVHLTHQLKDHIFNWLDTLEFGQSPTPQQLENQFDALIDLAVFTIGTADRQNFPWDKGFERVMKANLQKELGSNGNKRGGFKRDLVKPEGWSAPDLSDLVEKRGKLYLLEGADATGKSTFAKKLNVDSYYHCTWSEELDKRLDSYFIGILNSAINDLKSGKNVVIDRHFISENVYASLFRGGSKWACLNDYFVTQFNKYEAEIYFFYFEFDDDYLKHFLKISQEREEMFSDPQKAIEVNRLFRKIAQGDIKISPITLKNVKHVVNFKEKSLHF